MKFLKYLLLFALIFGLGYYVGQRPAEVKQKLREISGEVLEKTIGLEDSLSLQRAFLEAKGRMIQGKAHLLDHDYQGASQDLQQALNYLEKAIEVDPGISERLGKLMEKVREAQQKLAQGVGVSRQTLDEAQREVDGFLP